MPLVCNAAFIELTSQTNHQEFWGTQEYYWVFSTVNGGRIIEADLFEGLRGEQQ